MVKSLMILLMAIGLGGMFGCDQIAYPPGRDTVDWFGDGRFQILRDEGKKKILYDVQEQTTIATDVKWWRFRRGVLYATAGSNQTEFIVLNTSTGESKIYGDIQEVPDTDRAMFR